jgi:hypothetical protein
LAGGALRFIIKDADNIRLNSLLDNWGKEPSGKNFEKVMQELLNGNSYLILPSAKNKHEPGFQWTTSANEKLILTCIFEVEGVSVLGAFTNESAISNWAKGPQPYVMMKTKAVLELCEKNNIYKIVLNSDSPNIFLAERSRKHLN